METSLSGRRALVTGATAGIGKETARGLARLGAEVVIVGRDADKTRAVVEELKQSTGNPQVESVLCDLSSIAAVRRLGVEVARRFGALHILINNAGGMNPRREQTVDGFERTFAVNHLAYFVLANALLPTLKKSAPARIVQVASEAHRGPGFRPVHLDFDDLLSTRSYNPWLVYSRSKLANILHTRELARRAGPSVTANCLHPGFVASNFLDKPGFWRVVKPIAYVFALDNVAGARTSVYLASSPEVAETTGEYFWKCRLRRPTRAAEDDEAAKRLWAVSEELTGAIA
jgi:NAD(P)-dependent dehydrogenase (short-subunit alcohol dehydrogenase family)